MDFKLWSELNPKAKEELKPDFGFRTWDSLTNEEKWKIWKYLEFFFFDKNPKKNPFSEEIYYAFFGDDEYDKAHKEERILNSVALLNEKYKAKSYAINFLEKNTLISACCDFYEIFMKQSGNVVIELLSLYCKFLIDDSGWKDFDNFAKTLNEIFTDFGINRCLTRQGFIPRQEEKITKEIYEPVLRCLSHPKWKEISKLLSDSFDEYRKNTPQGYSNCVTNTISAIQAFLQIIVNGKTGKGEISKLILEAQRKKLVPDDFFTQKIFDNMESIFARERQETGIAHPKKEYATEKNARTLLNLAMVFFQHCIQK